MDEPISPVIIAIKKSSKLKSPNGVHTSALNAKNSTINLQTFEDTL